jgi:hypothetical protein
VAVRNRNRYRDGRRHRRTGGLQQAPRQHDDIVGVPRAKPRQGRCRWSAAARNRCRAPVRCTDRMVASATDAGVRELMSFRKAANLISHIIACSAVRVAQLMSRSAGGENPLWYLTPRISATFQMGTVAQTHGSNPAPSAKNSVFPVAAPSCFLLWHFSRIFRAFPTRSQRGLCAETNLGPI